MAVNSDYNNNNTKKIKVNLPLWQGNTGGMQVFAL